MFYIILMLLNLNLYSIEIIERYDNNVKIKLENSENFSFKLYESKNGKEFDKSKSQTLSISSNNNMLKGLKANTKYLLKNSEIELEFWTLAKEPIEAKTNIIFMKAKANNIKGRVSISDADGAYLLVSVNNNNSNLEDGKEYTTGKYGSKNNKIGNSYLIQKIKNGEEFILEDLEYNIYNFTLIPFNGKGESINYNLSKNTLRKYHPQLAIPKMKECEYFKENIAEIKWKEVTGTQYYEVTVAKDSNFDEILEEYNNANFNNGKEFKLFLEDETIKYYWKIKAVGIYNSSEYSEFNVIDYNLINSAKK